jgi:hypothetical protein
MYNCHAVQCGNGLQATNVRNLSCQECTACNNLTHGFQLLTTLPAPLNRIMQFKNCIATGNGTDGFNFFDDYNVNGAVIEECIANNNGRDGFRLALRNGIVSDNKAANNANKNIHLLDPNLTVAGANQVIDNITVHADTCIDTISTTTTNVVAGNFCYTSTTQTNYAITDGAIELIETTTDTGAYPKTRWTNAAVDAACV